MTKVQTHEVGARVESSRLLFFPCFSKRIHSEDCKSMIFAWYDSLFLFFKKKKVVWGGAGINRGEIKLERQGTKGIYCRYRI